MPPVFSRRFAIVSAIALALAILAFVLGAAVAVSIVAWIASSLGLEEVVFTGQADMHLELLLIRAKIGLVFALPLVVAWIAALIHRAKSRTDPSPLALSVYFAVPLIAGAAATLRQVLGWRFATLPEELDLPVLFSFTNLTPDAGLRYIPLMGVVLWAVVFARARRARPASGG